MSSSPEARRPRAALALLLFASTLTVMAGAIISPVLEVIRDDLDITGTEAGLLLTVHGLTIAVAGPLTGRFVDRFGPRTPLAAGLTLYGLAGGAGLLTDSYVALLLSRVVFGVGAAVLFTATTVAMLSLYQGPARDRVMGWRGTATSLGGVTWPLIGGGLGTLSWHAPFAVYALGLPLGLLTLRLMPRVAGGKPPAGPAVGGPTMVRRHPVLLGHYGLLALSTVLLYTVIVFAPLRLARLGVDSPFVVSLYPAAMAAVMGLVALAYAPLRARLGYDLLLRAAMGSAVVAFLLAGLSDSPALLALAVVVFGAGQGLVLPALTVLIGEAVPVQLRGKATALSATALFGGQFVSPLLIGPLAEATSLTTGFLTAAALAAAGLVPLLLVRLGGSEAPASAPPVPGAAPDRAGHKS